MPKRMADRQRERKVVQCRAAERSIDITMIWVLPCVMIVREIVLVMRCRSAWSTGAFLIFAEVLFRIDRR